MYERYECLNCGYGGPAREFRVTKEWGTGIHGGLFPHDVRRCPSCGSPLIEGRDELRTPGCPAGVPA